MRRKLHYTFISFAFLSLFVFICRTNAQPKISSLSVYSAYNGAAVTINGTNFDSVAAGNIIFFGSTKASITSGSSTSIHVTVPVGATYQGISELNTATNLSCNSLLSFLPSFNDSAYILSAINFNPQVAFSTTSSNAYGVVIADLDGDGKPDMAVCNYVGNSISVFRNTSSSGSITSSSFSSAVTFTTGTGPTYLKVADIDGDGKLDIVVTNASAGTVSVFRNTATSGSITSGSFAAKVDFSAGSSSVDVAVADFDGDGKPDLAVTNSISTSNTISVLRNTSSVGSISFSSPVTFGTGSIPVKIIAADFDGDGKPDLAVTNNSSNSVSVFRNTATSGSITSSSFATKVDFTTEANPRGIFAGDIDNDGKTDIVVTNRTGNNISVFHNTATSGAITSSSFAAQDTFTTGTAPYDVSMGDVDGNGKPDIVVTNFGATTVSVFRNATATGVINESSFIAKVDFATGGTGGPYGVAVGDLDGDGKPDIAIANSNSSGSVSVLRNNLLFSIINAGPMCIGAIRTLSDSTSGGAWSSGASSVATVSATGVVTAVSAGTAVISYSFTGAYDSAIIVVSALPTIAALTPNSATICLGSSLTLTAGTVVGSGTLISYNWTGPNSYSTSGTASTAVFTPTTTAASGVYSLTVTYPGTGCKSATAVTSPSVTVSSIPVLTVTPVFAAICNGSSTNITASGASTYSWSPGTGLSATTGATVSCNVISTTTYTVTGTSAAGCVGTKTQTITVNPMPVLTVTPVFAAICNGSSTNITASGASTYSWSPATGLSATTGATVSCNVTSTTTYTVTGTSVSGCVGAATQTITVNPIPVLTVTPVSSAICNGSSTNITASGASTYSWSPATGLTATTGATVSCNVTSTTTYTVTGTSVAGCIGTKTQTITVNPIPVLTVTPVFSAICNGSSTNITASGASTYSWSPATGLSATTGATVNCNVTSTTTYTVTGTSVSGCVGTGTQTITVNPIPVLTVTPVFAAICNGSSTNITASGASTYSWSPATGLSATTGATVSCNATSTTTYTVTGTSVAGCSGTKTQIITVNPSPFAGTITGENVVCIGASITLHDTAMGGTWSSTNILAATISAGVVTGLAPGSSTISYTVTNGCGTIAATHSITVSAMQWVGGTPGHETDWNTGANWTCGTVPGVSDDVSIPSGTVYLPVIAASDSAFSRNFNISTNITINTGAILNIKGNLENNGIVTGAGKLSMNGTIAQSISGTGNINNFDLDNRYGATITSGALLTINNTLSVTSGTLTTNDSLVLGSDSTVTARVAPLPASGSLISGNVRVMQYVQGGHRAYLFWAHPFSTFIPLSQIENYIDISGPGGTVNGFTSTGTESPSAFRYNTLHSNSGLAYDPGWMPFTSTYGTPDSNKFKPYMGIRLFYRGSKGEGLLVTSGYTISPTVVGMWGSLNQGNQTINLAKGTGTNQDYNMVGNPYASPVDIGTVIYNAKSAGNIAGSGFYIWDPFLGTAGQFVTEAIGTGSAAPFYLQQNNSFQVRAFSSSSVLNFAESNKTATSTFDLLRARPEYTTLMIYDTSYHPWDMIYVQFNDAATNAEDDDYDAAKPMNGATDFNCYSMSSDNKKLSLDARPYLAGSVIPLGIVSSYAQEFIIRAEGVAVPDSGQLYLHDKLLKQYVLLQQGTEYRFTITADSATQGNNRFELYESTDGIPAVPDNTGLQVNMTPNPATKEVNINFTQGSKQQVSLRVMDISGVRVYSQELGSVQNGSVSVPLGGLVPGIYMVELISGDQKVTKQLIKE